MRKLTAVIAALCLTLCGCAQKEYTDTLFAMDTVMDLKVLGSEDALTAADAEIRRIDALFDRGNADSEIYRINTDKSAVISDETAKLIRTAIEFSERTDGAFDITTAPLSDLWGFYGGNYRVPTDGEIETALTGVGYEKIRLDGSDISIPQNTSIDLGGIAKGYASDRAAAVMRENGASSAILSLGGNVYALGKKADGSDWTVGITDPFDTSRLIGTVSVSDKAVVTSGGYQRYFESGGKTYHHIIDPKTGMSADSDLSSVTVISDSGTAADALSTALFVMGYDKSAELWRGNDDFDAVFVLKDGSICVTAGIADGFESDTEYTVINR